MRAFRAEPFVVIGGDWGGWPCGGGDALGVDVKIGRWQDLYVRVV